MRTFEFKDDKAYKFWRIELAGQSFTVKFGRIGTKGQEQTKEFPSAAAAKTAHDKLIDEKLKKGYVETTKSKSAPASPREALENALVANPDDLGAHAAYADWLIEQGDPRGEFIQVQLALEDEKKPAKVRKELQKREKALLKKHQREWLGELADYLVDLKQIPAFHGMDDAQQYGYRFARGWLSDLEIDGLTVEFARALARSGMTRRLTRLAIQQCCWYPEDGPGFEPGPDVPANVQANRNQAPGLFALRSCPGFDTLRIFQLGIPVTEEYESYTCHTDGRAAHEVIGKMPALEELYLLAHDVDTDVVFAMKSLRNLRVLQVYHGHHYPLRRLAANPALANLTHLFLHPGGQSFGQAHIRIDGLRALLKSPHLKKLVHLKLRISDVGDQGCAEIVRSGILRRLKVLDLQHGCITDKGAAILAACPDLSRLEWLNLDRNQLSSDGVEALEGAVAKLYADDQCDDEEIEYQMWLGEGDAE